jgi:uncharacterized protein DUF3455
MSLPSKVSVFFLTVLLIVAFFIGCAAPRLSEAPVAVPGKLAPGANEALTMIFPAGGVQIYECRAQKDGGYEWGFVAPEADLYDGHGAKVGTHYAGPVWESGDGSKVAGTVKERADAPQAGAIPWLLLTAKSVGPEGSLSRVTSIQRVHTSGGVAPKDGCSQATIGAQARVGYIADYYFFTPSRPNRDSDALY